MATEKDVLAALGGIIDPDFNRDIVSLGFVRNIQIKEDMVSLDIVLTTPACPVRAEFQRQAETSLLKLSGIKHVNVNMTSQPPAQPKAGLATSSLADIGSIIAVSSCKGGVGKSTIAAYLAQELARRGFKVGLIDADIHGPSIPTLFDLNQVDVHVNDKKQLIPVEKNNLKIMSFGFLLGDAPAVMRGPMVSRYIQQILQGTAWGKLDYLFIDMPPGTGDVQLTITQSVRLNGAVIVTTRQTLSLVDVSRGILMFEKVDVPILGVIENMSYFVCDKCEKKHYIFGGSEQALLEERFGIETLAEIPIMPELLQKIDKPLVNEFIARATDKVIMALGKNSIEKKELPQIGTDAHNITLTWPSGEKVTVGNRELRLSCQCALCMDEISGKKLLDPQKVRQDIAPKEITPLGNYAIGIAWNDGHSSGIYPYKLIRELGNAPSRAAR